MILPFLHYKICDTDTSINKPQSTGDDYLMAVYQLIIDKI